jgi:hypothetical protein
VSADHIVILIIVLALAVKFVFFDLSNKYQPGDSAGTHTSKLVLVSMQGTGEEVSTLLYRTSIAALLI